MRNFNKKRNIGSLFYSTPVLAVLGLILLVFLYNLFGLLGKMRETVKNKNTAEEKLAELSVNKEKLTQDIARLSTEEGKEENIREKFGLVKEGEGVIIIVEEEEKVQVDLEANTGGFLNFFKNMFK